MAIFNDGTNYFSGSALGPTDSSSLPEDIEAMLTTLGVPYLVEPSSISYTPEGDNLVGISGAINSSNGVSTTAKLADQSRFAMALGFVNSTSGESAGYLLNSSTSDTEVTVPGKGIGRPDYWFNAFGNSKSWAVATAKSLAIFTYKDRKNYLFRATGVVNSPDGYVFPESIYGLLIGKYNDNQKTSFRGVTANSNIPVEFHTKGNIANYDRIPLSGEAAEACLLLPRRVDNNYAIGTCPNIVSVKRANVDAAGILPGDYPINLTNISPDDNSLDGSGQSKFIYVGNLDDTVDNDGAGDGIFMRIFL
jgi:hypothetical protein